MQEYVLEEPIVGENTVERKSDYKTVVLIVLSGMYVLGFGGCAETTLSANSENIGTSSAMAEITEIYETNVNADDEAWTKTTDIEEIPVEYEVYNKELETIAYPQISGLDDKELEDKVNESLAYVFEHDIASRLSTKEYGSNPTEILFQNGEYLSVKTSLYYFNPYVGGGRLISFPIYQTVSLRTGEILSLDDFLEIDEEFVQFLLDSPVAIRASKQIDADFSWDESFDKEIRVYIKEEYSAEDLLAYFNEASMDYNSENLSNKCAFYLTPHEINIAYETNTITINYFKMRLELNDVEDYIKVPKW